jgi:hypothetical protein
MLSFHESLLRNVMQRVTKQYGAPEVFFSELAAGFRTVLYGVLWTIYF